MSMWKLQLIRWKLFCFIKYLIIIVTIIIIPLCLGYKNYQNNVMANVIEIHHKSSAYYSHTKSLTSITCTLLSTIFLFYYSYLSNNNPTEFDIHGVIMITITFNSLIPECLPFVCGWQAQQWSSGTPRFFGCRR